MYQRGPLPYYGGLVSFYRAPGIELDQIREGMAVVAGVPIDSGIPTGRSGARYGPRAVRQTSMRGQSNMDAAPEKTLINLHTGKGQRLKERPNIGDFGDFNIYPTDLMRTTESVKQGMAEIVKRGGFPVVIGGDHYVTYPSFEGFARGMAERKPGARLGYIHIDSHSDFHDSMGEIGGRYNHGTMVRRISENPMVSFKNLAWVGLNSALTTDQQDLRRRHHLLMTTSKQIYEQGVEEIMKLAMDTAADGVDAVYVSVDIDVIDASESPGTGSPEFEGIRASEFLWLMEMLSEYKPMAAIDLCEVAPEWDLSGRTELLAARGLTNVLRPWLFDTVELPE
jgi:agmatinase